METLMSTATSSNTISTTNNNIKTSNKTNRNKYYTCGICQKVESRNWKRHWQTKHSDQIPFEWSAATMSNQHLGYITPINSPDSDPIPGFFSDDQQCIATSIIIAEKMDEKMDEGAINKKEVDLNFPIQYENSNFPIQQEKMACDLCNRSFQAERSLNRHKYNKHGFQRKRDLKVKGKELFTCTLCLSVRKAFLLKWQYNRHLKKYHSQTSANGRPKIRQTLSLKSKQPRNLKISLTGNTAGVRPLIKLLLRKLGFHYTDYPAKGIKGLICGDTHIPSKSVLSHGKYQLAEANQVPIIFMKDLPSQLKMELKELNAEIMTLQQEISQVHAGDKRDIIHFVWRGHTRFILLSAAAFQALSLSQGTDSPPIMYGDKDFNTVMEANLNALKKHNQAMGSSESVCIELYIRTQQSSFHFVGVVRAKSKGIKVCLFQTAVPIQQVKVRTLQNAGVGVIISNRKPVIAIARNTIVTAEELSLSAEQWVLRGTEEAKDSDAAVPSSGLLQILQQEAKRLILWRQHGVIIDQREDEEILFGNKHHTDDY